MAALLSIKSPSMETIESGYPTDYNSKTTLYQQNGNSNGSFNGNGTNGNNTKYGVSNPALELDADMDVEKKGAMAAVDLTTNYPDQEKDHPNKKDVVDVGASSEPVKIGCVRQYGGMLLTLAASVLFSLVIVLVKALQKYGQDAEDSAFWRYAGITFPSIPILFYYECKLRSNNKKGIKSKKGKLDASVFDTVWPPNKKENLKTIAGLLIRGFLGASSVILRYFALNYLTIGDTSVISYSSPILVAILAHFFLGEKTGWIPIFTTFLALGGVVIITQPPILTGADHYDDRTLIGTGLAVGSLVCSAVMTVITRKIRQVQFALMLTVFGVMGMIQAYIISQVMTGGGFSLPKGTIEFFMLLGVAGLSFIAQMCIVLALKFEQAGPVALIRTCDVVFGFLFQFIFFGITPNIWSAVGGSIVFFGVIVTATRKYISTLPKEHWFRRTFRFLMY